MSAPKRGRPASRPPASTRAATQRAGGRRPATTARPAPRRDLRARGQSAATEVSRPWNALWAMMVGFFMILVDSTIVAVANPSIMEKLQTDYDAVIWVTSAYLLAYAVPLLVAGRLGDQFGPKNLYLVGLSVFTAASLWCGLAGSIEVLITARVVQGIGAALLTPQTLSTITRIFPADRRGVAMSVWGATAGVATLVGPLAGGVLVDHLGWQWIFIVNVPIGIIGLGLAYWLIPVLPTHRHRFDVLGVLLSGLAMFLVVFALQEGQSRGWPLWIWLMIVSGLIIGAIFVRWQAVNTREPLIPLQIFQDRDFSLSNVGVAVIGFVVTSMIVPVMFYAQLVAGLSPTRSALLTAPMAVLSGVLAPVVGRIIDRVHPRPMIGFGFSMLAVGLTWLSAEMTPTTPIWRLVLPFLVLGVSSAFIWAPLATTATRNLPPELAGAGSGVYNATRQVGTVLGSAGIAAFMTARIGAEVPGGDARPPAEAAVAQLPAFLREPFAAALSQSMLLPAFVALFGVVAALFMVGMVKPGGSARRPPAERPADRVSAALNASTEILPRFVDDPFDSRYRRTDRYPEGYVHDDDDGYVEYLISLPAEPEIDDGDTEPLAVRVPHPVHAPAELRYADPAGARRGADEPVQPTSIGFAHNGFHVDDNERFQPMPPAVATAEPVADGFDRLADQIETFSASFFDLPDPGEFDEPQTGSRSGRHYREDPDDEPGRGRHSMP